jgi:hypothetical protein
MDNTTGRPYRTTAWKNSADARRGKKLTDEHKKKLGDGRRGHTPKGKLLWPIAEDALDSLPTSASRGNQARVHILRQSLGFPKGWPGAFHHGEVLTRDHIHEFCDDTGLDPEEAAKYVGFGFGAFRNLVGKFGDRPLSSRYPNNPNSPHIGKRLREKYNHVVERFCYLASTHGKTREFLRSELLKIPVQRAKLAIAFGVLRDALDAKETAPDAGSICEWLCVAVRLRREQAPAEPATTALQMLLFFGKSLRKLIGEKPQLFTETLSDGARVFWPRNVADELLAIDYGATPGRIRYLTERGDLFPLDGRVLAVVLRQEIETARTARPAKIGRPTLEEKKKETKEIKIARKVEDLILGGMDKKNARDAIAKQEKLDRETVVSYHKRFLKTHPRA